MPAAAAAKPDLGAPRRLLLVDGHAYAYRAFHAIRQLDGPDGAPTNAIFGFVKMLAKLRALLQPTHVAVVWDGGLAAERMALLPGYKAQRPPMPEGLRRQLDEIVTFLGAARVTSLRADGVEADDWLATLARRAAAAGLNVVIASSDKDFMQLVSPQIGLYNPNDKSEAVWTREQVAAKTGVEPEQIVDYLSLVGDAVDNIPGAVGVGPKTAAELLRQFVSIEALLARLPEVKSDRVRASLATSAADLRRNQQMIRLYDDLPLATPLETLAVRDGDNDALLALYTRWGFGSLRRELEAAKPPQGDLFR